MYCYTSAVQYNVSYNYLYTKYLPQLVSVNRVIYSLAYDILPCTCITPVSRFNTLAHGRCGYVIRLVMFKQL